MAFLITEAEGPSINSINVRLQGRDSLSRVTTIPRISPSEEAQSMFSESPRRSAGFALALILVSAPLNRSWAQSLSPGDTTPHAASVFRNLKISDDLMAGESKQAAIREFQGPLRPRCNVKRRILIGAAVGFVGGVVVVRKAADANGGVVGAKTKLQAGGYGAALGTFIGLGTCRRP